MYTTKKLLPVDITDTMYFVASYKKMIDITVIAHNFEVAELELKYICL